MRVRQRLVRLERLLQPPARPRPDEVFRERRWQEIWQRFTGFIERALPLLSAAEQEQVVSALEQLDGPFEGPYGDWLLHLSWGWCRLPDLSAEAGKSLLLAWLSPEADGSQVCTQCGLEYPDHRAPPMHEWKVLPGKTPLQDPPPWCSAARSR
jgi:hypothetical protein